MPSIKVKDEQIVEFIAKYRSENGYSPTVREVMEGVGLKSLGSLRYRLAKMRDKGLVSFVDGCSRTLVVVR